MSCAVKRVSAYIMRIVYPSFKVLEKSLALVDDHTFIIFGDMEYVSVLKNHLLLGYSS